MWKKQQILYQVLNIYMYIICGWRSILLHVIDYWVINCVFVFIIQTVGLTFGFPFYGHTVKKVTIATGGKLTNKNDVMKKWENFLKLKR